MAPKKTQNKFAQRGAVLVAFWKHRSTNDLDGIQYDDMLHLSTPPNGRIDIFGNHDTTANVVVLLSFRASTSVNTTANFAAHPYLPSRGNLGSLAKGKNAVVESTASQVLFY